MKNRISENKPIEQIRDESAQVYCDPDTQRVYRNGFNAAIQLCEQRERDLVEAIDSLANKLGQDILSVEHETVWGDPNNVKITLELTEDLRKRLFKSLKNLVKLYGKKKE
jgi:sugar phosphate isomerase/epimerase